MKSALTIIIVNWNGEKFLPACLESIADNPPSMAFETILVDNASTDGSVAWLKSAEAVDLRKKLNLELVESDENLGFGRANNLAIERTEAEFILLLNPDTVVKPGSIDILLDALKTNETTGAVAPKLLNEDGSLQQSVVNFPPTPFKIILENFRVHTIFPKRFVADQLLFSFWDHSSRRIVPIAWGAVLLFKGAILRQLKGFDPDFFIYGEDMDLCIRLSKLGFDLEFVPESSIVHLGGKSAVQSWNETQINEKKIRMGLLFERKHCGRLLYFANLGTRIAIGAIRLVVNPLIGRDNQQAKKAIRIYFE